MKHTSRKKMLLSSIAMLLVAMMALGSATFAWFTSNPYADAKGISLKTTAATGLVIKTDTDSTWSHEAKLANGGDTQDMVPVSQNQTTLTMYTAAADAADKYQTSATPSETSSGYYTENIYCRLSDGSDATAAASDEVYVKAVKISAATGATMQGTIRVALAVGGSLLGTYSLDSAKPNGVLAPTADSFSPALVTNAGSLDVATGLTGLTADATDESKVITVYAYMDGQDTDCYSDKVGTVNITEIIKSIQVDLELK